MIPSGVRKRNTNRYKNSRHRMHDLQFHILPEVYYHLRKANARGMPLWRF